MNYALAVADVPVTQSPASRWQELLRVWEIQFHWSWGVWEFGWDDAYANIGLGQLNLGPLLVIIMWPVGPQRS